MNQRELRPNTSRVRLVGIDMPFWSIMGFLIKMALAAVPMLIIVVTTVAIMGVVLSGLMPVFASMLPIPSASKSSVFRPLVVAVWPDENGWVVRSESDRRWSNCELLLNDAVIQVPFLPPHIAVFVPRRYAPLTHNPVADVGSASAPMNLICRSPQSAVARMYWFSTPPPQ
jgi:hypothetical protein